MEQQWNPHAQNWPGYYDYPHQAHPDQRNTADHQYRPPKPVDIQQPRPHPQQQPVTASVPDRSSSQQWHQPVAHPGGPTYDAGDPSIYGSRSEDEILEDEYDSSELFDEDELELELELEPLRSVDSTPIKTPIEDKVPEKEDEDETLDILSAFGLTPGLSSLPRQVEESGSDKEIEPLADVPQVSPPLTQEQITWQHYPQLLAPRTPPGKRVIVTEEHPASNPKAVDNHRVSYGLTAASVYARLQPSLRPRNGTGGLRQKVVPRPYKRRPITVTSTTNLPVANFSETPEDEEDFTDTDLITEQTEIDFDDMEDTELEDEEPIAKDEDDSLLNTKENVNKESTTEKEAVKPIPEEIVKKEVKETEKEEPVVVVEKNPTVVPITVENETLKSKTSPAAIANNPVDIKTLLRSAGPLSLSEILQQKGMSLAELLKGGSRVAPVIGITTIGPNTNIQADTTTTQHASSSTTIQSITTTTKASVTTSRPETLPTVKPISLRELLAAKNMSLQEIVQPSIRSNSSATEKPSSSTVAPTLKPGVKRPIPFAAGRGKGLVGLVAPSAPAEEPSTEQSPTVAQPPQPSKPLSQKPINELKPMIFGGARPIEETESTTTTTTTRTTTRQMVIHSKRPYIAGTNVGEYGTHLGRSFEEDEDEENNGTRSLSSNMIGSYGMQRPIATSRLTPPPPRKQRPVLNFNYNALSEDEENDDTTDTTTQAPILTHFNEEELSENHPYFDLPVSVRNAIIVSSTIGGFCLIVFIVILVVFRIRQKTRIRLRHPAALLGLGGVIDTTASNGSDSSGITTPVSHPASKSGYAKLPRRSSSLWGTLRRSVRQMESVHYS